MVIKICAAHSGLQERRPDPKRSRAVTTETNTSSFAAIVVAAGKGLRVGGDLPKQFRNWHGKPMIRHSVEALITAGCEKLVLVVPHGMQERALKAVGLDQDILAIEGGLTRQQSVLAGLEALAAHEIDKILIHDAARPDLPGSVIERLLSALEVSSGAIPVLPVVDSLAIDEAGKMAGSADREQLRRVQTPQAFRFKAILTAHRAWQGQPHAGDDAQVLTAAGGDVTLVEGDERLKKMTFAKDFVRDVQPFRVGQGFDVHRMVAGEELWLCGIKIDHDRGLAGHSDADVALHAVVDALLGAIGAGDIGTHFPPSDPQWKGAASPLFLSHATKLVQDAGFGISNIDVTVICEEPKIGPHREAMRSKLAELIGIELDRVSVKATTTERLGFTGRGEGLAAQAIVSLQGD
jgi:2-C-methyl-D-erythritol 4-phosphate cytidylyltransferase/2-C-methyl-D-erythritol 2,4-cyclodiphosphate synthase